MCVGPRTVAAGFHETTRPTTSQSNSRRMAAKCCLNRGRAVDALQLLDVEGHRDRRDLVELEPALVAPGEEPSHGLAVCRAGVRVANLRCEELDHALGGRRTGPLDDRRQALDCPIAWQDQGCGRRLELLGCRQLRRRRHQRLFRWCGHGEKRDEHGEHCMKAVYEGSLQAAQVVQAAGPAARTTGCSPAPAPRAAQPPAQSPRPRPAPRWLGPGQPRRRGRPRQARRRAPSARQPRRHVRSMLRRRTTLV